MANYRALQAKIHIAKKDMNLDDDKYRALLYGATGKDSTKGMSYAEMEAVLKAFTEKGWEQTVNKSKNARPMFRKKSTKGYIRKVYSLWGVLKKEGIVKARFPDGFCKRIVEIDNTDKLDKAEANKVIEALKQWCDREGVIYDT